MEIVMDLKLIVKLERRLTDLINFLKQEISKKNLDELEEYRDVGEYGLCLVTRVRCDSCQV